MQANSSATREFLRYAGKLRDTTVILAPSKIGPIERDDLQMSLQDVALLLKLGVKIYAAEYIGSTFWQGLEWPEHLPRISVENDEHLIATAVSYGAGKLCLVAGSDRITIRGQQLDEVPLAKAEAILAESRAPTLQSRHALELAVSACRAGVSRVHIYNAHRDGALLDELFTNLGVATMVYAGAPRKEVRRVVPADYFGVRGLIRHVIPRQTVEFVRTHQGEMRVFTVDGDIHGVARLSRRNDTLLIHLLAHSSRWNAAEVLERLLRGALEEAREQKAQVVALLADEMPPLMRILPWFTGLGFKKGRTILGAGEQDAWLKTVA